MFCYPGCLAPLVGSIREWLEEVWHNLTRLLQDPHQIFLWGCQLNNLLYLWGYLYLAIIRPVDERKGSTIISNPARSPNPAENLVDPIFKSPPLNYLWTYSSISPGMSKLITFWTSGISRPRASTAVAVNIEVLPALKSARACDIHIKGKFFFKQLNQ